MDQIKGNKSMDNQHVFLAPNTKSATGKKKSSIELSSTLTDTKLQNSPKRRRPKVSRNDSGERYNLRRSRSRSSSKSGLSSDEETNSSSIGFCSQKNPVLPVYSSSRQTRKRTIVGGGSSKSDISITSGSEEGEDGDSLLTSTGTSLRKRTTKTSRQTLRKKQNKETINPPFDVLDLESQSTGSNQKRKRVVKKASKATEKPDVVLRQNYRGKLIAFDNTEIPNSPKPLTSARRGFTSAAAATSTVTWEANQMLEIQAEQEEIELGQIEPSTETFSIVIIDNRLFKFSSVPEEVQNVSENYYVTPTGEKTTLSEIKSDSNPLIEEIVRIPVKISKFYTSFGFYFGHRRAKKDKIKRTSKKGFANENITEGFYVYCRLCQKNHLKICAGGSAANFGRHLKETHKIQDPLQMNLGVIKLDDKGVISYGSSTRYRWDHSRQVTGLDLLLQCLMDSNMPFSNVERFSLKRLLNFFDPQFTLPCSKTLAALLAKKVETEVVTNLQKTLSEVQSCALVVDIWSSKNMQGVLGMSVIFLDGDFVWKKKTLAVSRISGPHTAENVRQKISSVIEKWPLKGKIRFIVSDGGSNMVRSLADLHELAMLEDVNDTHLLEGIAPRLESEEYVTIGEPPTSGFRSNFCFAEDDDVSRQVFVDSDLKRTEELSSSAIFLFEENMKPHKCITHTLQRVLADGMKDERAKAIQVTIRKVAAFGRKRQVSRDISKAMTNKVPTRPGTTRWNSTVDSGWILWEPDVYDLVGHLIENSRMTASVRDSTALPETLTTEFYDQLYEFLQISDPVAKLTDELQADGITGHLVIPGIARAHNEIVSLKGFRYMMEYQKLILDSFERRMKEFVNDKDFILATVLCPYYKLAFFEIYHEDLPTIEEHLKNHAKDTEMPIFDANPLSIPSVDFVKELCFTHLQTTDEMELVQEPSTIESAMATNCSYAQRIQARYLATKEAKASKKTEFEKYLELDISMDPPAEFWIKQKETLSKLFQKARNVFCKPASSGLVERLFSLVADINRSDRVNLNVRTMEEIVMYKEFINLPKTYKEATANIFTADEDQLTYLLEKWSADKGKMSESYNNET